MRKLGSANFANMLLFFFAKFRFNPSVKFLSIICQHIFTNFFKRKITAKWILLLTNIPKIPILRSIYLTLFVMNLDSEMHIDVNFSSLSFCTQEIFRKKGPRMFPVEQLHVISQIPFS